LSPLKTARELEYFRGPKIVTVGLVAGNEILSGKRRDNGLWTSPGGHVDDGEGIFEAAKREVAEEAGIQVDDRDLELIRAERVVSHRTGAPFVVFAFIAHIDKGRATAKNDPDKEISEWKWLALSKDTPELQPEARHAKEDFVLIHLGIWNNRRLSMADEKTEGPQEKGRTIQEVSKDLQTAGYNESPEPEQPKVAEPKQKTPEEMATDPEEFLRDENATGD